MSALVSLMIAPCDTSTGTIGVTLIKSYVTSCFAHLDSTNIMIPLMILLVFCDGDAGDSDITRQKNHIASCFNCLDLKTSGATDDTSTDDIT